MKNLIIVEIFLKKGKEVFSCNDMVFLWDSISELRKYLTEQCWTKYFFRIGNIHIKDKNWKDFEKHNLYCINYKINPNTFYNQSNSSVLINNKEIKNLII